MFFQHLVKMAKYELCLAFNVKTIVWEGNLFSLWLFVKCRLFSFVFAFCSICRCYIINDVFPYLFIVVLRNVNEVTCFKHYKEPVVAGNCIHRAARKEKESLFEGILFFKCMLAFSEVERRLLLLKGNL